MTTLQNFNFHDCIAIVTFNFFDLEIGEEGEGEVVCHSLADWMAVEQETEIEVMSIISVSAEPRDRLCSTLDIVKQNLKALVFRLENTKAEMALYIEAIELLQELKDGGEDPMGILKVIHSCREGEWKFLLSGEDKEAWKEKWRSDWYGDMVWPLPKAVNPWTGQPEPVEKGHYILYKGGCFTLVWSKTGIEEEGDLAIGLDVYSFLMWAGVMV